MTINSYYWDLFSLLATALVTSTSVTAAAAVSRSTDSITTIIYQQLVLGTGAVVTNKVPVFSQCLLRCVQFQLICFETQ